MKELSLSLCICLATCDPIVIPSGASMNLSSDGTNTLAIFTCNVGASLLGEPVLTCLEDGTWDLSPPTCGKFSHQLDEVF